MQVQPRDLHPSEANGTFVALETACACRRGAQTSPRAQARLAAGVRATSVLVLKGVFAGMVWTNHYLPTSQASSGSSSVGDRPAHRQAQAALHLHLQDHPSQDGATGARASTPSVCSGSAPPALPKRRVFYGPGNEARLHGQQEDPAQRPVAIQSSDRAPISAFINQFGLHQTRTNYKGAAPSAALPHLKATGARDGADGDRKAAEGSAARASAW